MLQDAPDHITDDTFKDLTVVMNITGKLQQHYYDDGISAGISAELQEGVLTITTGIPAANFRVYAAADIHEAVVNGKTRPVLMDGNTYVI